MLDVSVILECQLCGARVKGKRRFVGHVSLNHSLYRSARQCQTCLQHFGSVSFMHKHQERGWCPGRPDYYSTTTGRLFYRTSNSHMYTVGNLYPRLRFNNLVATKGYSEYCVEICSSKAFDRHENSFEPYGAVSTDAYNLRVFNPAYPESLLENKVKIGNEDPIDSQDLDRLCGFKVRRPRRKVASSDVNGTDLTKLVSGNSCMYDMSIFIFFVYQYCVCYLFQP